MFKYKKYSTCNSKNVKIIYGRVFNFGLYGSSITIRVHFTKTCKQKGCVKDCHERLVDALLFL